MTITNPWSGTDRIGSGLQYPRRVNLGGSAHGGVTVRITSGDTLRLLVSPDAVTAGTSFIDLVVLDGRSYADFYVQGVSGITGDVTVSATSSEFADAAVVISIVEPVLYLDLGTSYAATSGDIAFTVYSGILDPSGAYIWEWQPASASGPVHVLVRSSNPEYGVLTTAAQQQSQEVTVDIQPNEHTSPSSVGSGGMAFDPVAVGITEVSAFSIGFNNLWQSAFVDVTVTP
ncbi:MAG: hypothetical protein AB9866_04710 [Syntrophobacteraceae bacterium]